ncbi:hypothetical protein FHG66_12165 [Rubellimicrobium rubrum]|uniref:Alcohol dehydrogenase-like N-terminal domain-containing protein n=1 Tax=Rubellimicrobium rubrum TaxID=2585369 RepID=A0A5C4MWU8_9RHOB|nr:alcohol dehydrogenase catalytic domain-containing protein [Rubellimicrobium rubrum]TNC49193.1 hypothetical protein FHG66_12165 [Rubellimicrobium rubrum]
MLASDYRGPRRVRTDQKPMPAVEHPRAAIFRVTRSCICGSDLHLYSGVVPAPYIGMTFGREFTADVEDVAPEVARVEVLRFIEHNRLPAVVGTSTPPQGPSGVMRRVAFRDRTHRLLLPGADRVNVAEGVLTDLARGKVRNMPAEMGIRAARRHDSPALVAKVAAAAIVGVLATTARRRRNSRTPRTGQL